MSTVKQRIREILSEVGGDAPERNAFVEGAVKPDRRPWRERMKDPDFPPDFFDRIEVEFAVCFPDDAHLKRWSLDDFAAYVEARSQKPEVNLRMADKVWRNAKNYGAMHFLFPNFFLGLAIFATYWPYRWIWIALLVIFDALLVRRVSRQFLHYRR